MSPDFGKRLGFSIQFRFIVLSVAIGLFSFMSEPVQASGSWGSARGAFGSGGGAWGGGLMGGRAPVRNLLGRLNSRVANVGNGSIGSRLGGGSLGSGFGAGPLGSRLGGGSFGSRLNGGSGGGGLLAGCRGGLLGFGVLGGSRGGFLGTGLGANLGSRLGAPNYYGSSGSMGYASSGSSFVSTAPLVAPSYQPVVSQPIYSSPVVQAAPTYAIPNYDSTCFCNSSSSYSMEQSYPVGDYGFQPGYPIQTSNFSSGMTDMGFGSIVDGSMVNGGVIDGSLGVPIEGSGEVPITAPVLDGGSIDSMLENGGMPLNQGISVEPAPAAGSGDYYTPPTGDAPGANPNLPRPAEDDATYLEPSLDTKAVLNLVLPRRAKVYINGKLTRTPGSFRSYVSKRLTENKDYKYQVKAVLQQNGKEVVRSKLVTMRPGVTQTVSLDFNNAQTTLALTVPRDAKVTLCGNKTLQTGTVRQFTTTSLKAGQTWNDYLVSVEYEVNGEKKVENRTLDLASGETRRIVIGGGQSVDQIASR